MKKILMLFLTLLLLLGCSKKEEEVIVEEEEKPLFEIESISPSDYYPNLDNVFIIDQSESTFLILIPSDYNQVDSSFLSQAAFKGEWTITLSEKEDLEDFMASFDDYANSNDYIDSGVLYANNTYSRNIFDKESSQNMFYFAMNKDEITIKMFITYVEEELDEPSIAVLQELKEVYLLDLLDVPEIPITESEEPLGE